MPDNVPFLLLPLRFYETSPKDVKDPDLRETEVTQGSCRVYVTDDNHDDVDVVDEYRLANGIPVNEVINSIAIDDGSFRIATTCLKFLDFASRLLNHGPHFC